MNNQAHEMSWDELHRLSDKIRVLVPEGTRVRLVKMDDRNAPPVGTEGTVSFVDSMCTVHVKWDNGSTLGLAYMIDEYQIVKS